MDWTGLRRKQLLCPPWRAHRRRHDLHRRHKHRGRKFIDIVRDRRDDRRLVMLVLVRQTRLFSVLALLGIAACPDAPDEPLPPLTEDNAFELYARVTCTNMERCQCSQESVSWPTCRDEQEAFFEDWRGEAERDGLTLDLDCLERRLSAAEGPTCVTPSELCLVFYGAAGEGEPCVRYDVEGMFATCARGLFCPPGLDLCVREGVNFFAPTLDLDQQCLDENVTPVGTCDGSLGLFCDIDGPVPVCAPMSELGGPCSRTAACRAGFCDAGACRERKPKGYPCESPSECSAGTCLDGSCQDTIEIPAGCAPFLL